jgi:hypothetical protein
LTYVLTACSTFLQFIGAQIIPAQGIDRKTRQCLFEGSHLLFGFIVGKPRSLKLHESQLADSQTWPYQGAMQTSNVCDSRTNEPITEPVQIGVGIFEKVYLDASGPKGMLFSIAMQPNLVRAA